MLEEDEMAYPKPIPNKELRRRIKTRRALAQPPDDVIRESFFVAGPCPGVNKVEVSELEADERAGTGTHRVDVGISGRRLGQHVFPPGMRNTRLSTRRKRLEEQEHEKTLTGYLPDHLTMRPLPQRLKRKLVVPKLRFAGEKLDDETRWATTVFPPEDRFTFSDTSFPWCTCGRVDTAGGVASGVMIGPRHLLTVSHTVDWIANPSPHVAGWIKFTPSYYDGSEPFGAAWGIHIYWMDQVDGPTIDGTEAMYDYVIVVLDRRMGNSTGWMGARTYSDAWDGGDFWSHIGYPGDLASLQRPSFENGFSLDGEGAHPAAHKAMYHQADVWPGQSGGPMFGWWSGEPWPRAVSVQSWQNGTTNGASGGGDMVDMIIRARNDFA